MEWKEFRQIGSRGVAKVWKIKVEGNEIHTQWGLLDGAIQTVKDVLKGVNVGKSNEISPEDYALNRMEEIVRKKKREGYREFVDGKLVDDEVKVDIDFDNLPESLCFYKPDNTMGAGMTKKAAEGKVMYTRKRNGLAFIASKGPTGIIKLYSRRMLKSHDLEDANEHPWSERFPHIVQDLQFIMPKNTIVLGELVMNREGKDDFKHVQSVVKSLTSESIKRQEENGKLSFYIWDIPFFAGTDLVSNEPHRERYTLIHDLLNQDDKPYESLLGLLDYNFKTQEEAIKFAKEQDWEGWVVVDPLGIYGNKGYNFRGKPDRPGSFCSKLKPEFEDDFIAVWDPSKGKQWGEQSTKGRYDGGIKSVALYQYNKAGELVYICDCASGMTQKMKTELADPKFWPRVWEVRYTDRRFISQGDDTNALDFPRFFRDRSDKSQEECVNSYL